jgi:hypothetical protein
MSFLTIRGLVSRVAPGAGIEAGRVNSIDAQSPMTGRTIRASGADDVGPPRLTFRKLRFLMIVDTSLDEVLRSIRLSKPRPSSLLQKSAEKVEAQTRFKSQSKLRGAPGSTLYFAGLRAILISKTSLPH